jgi:hypothetical protein
MQYRKIQDVQYPFMPNIYETMRTMHKRNLLRHRTLDDKHVAAQAAHDLPVSPHEEGVRHHARGRLDVEPRGPRV